MLQEAPPSTGMPSILESLLQANCDPNHFGHPPKSPLNEAVLRNSVATVRLLIEGRANCNLQARGHDMPLVFAVKQHRSEMVRCLLELRANPMVTFYSPANDHPRARYVPITVKELTEPDSDIAHLIEHAIREWTSTDFPDGIGAPLAQTR